MESLRLSKPHLIIMVGIPGAGKSYFAERFADSFKAPIVSTGLIRKNLFEKPNFSKAENYLVDKAADYLLQQLMRTGRTIIYKGQSETRAERSDVYAVCKNNGYQPLLVWVQTDIETAKKRLCKQIGDKDIAKEQFDSRFKRFCPPVSNEQAVVISGKYTYESQLKIVLQRLIVNGSSQSPSHNRPGTIESRQYLIR